MNLKLTVTADIDTAAILDKRGLGASLDAAMHLAETARDLCDPYVPMEEGTLKNTARIVKSGGRVYIVYGQPYAHYQYTGEVYGPNRPIRDKATGEVLGFYSDPGAPKYPTGRELTYSGSPLRGKEWDKRMIQDRGNELGRELARYVGGKYR